MPIKKAWDGVDRRNGDDLVRWRGEIDKRHEENKARFFELEKGLQANTHLTASIDERTKSIDERLTPVAEAWDTVQAGLRVLGGIGKFGLFLVKHWQYIVGAALFALAWFHGEGLEGAIKAFWKGASGDK